MLYECDLEHEIVPIDILNGDQFSPEFLSISPNNRIPAIVDSDGPDGKEISIFETAAILCYLANKSGKFLPNGSTEPGNHFRVMEWLMWQMGGIGPMMGQSNHFRRYAPETIPYAIDRYFNEVKRLFGVADKRLSDNRFLAGDEYSIADIACFPWMRGYKRHEVPISDFPNIERWFDEIGSRPAVQKGLDVLNDKRRTEAPKGKEWEIMFGKDQFKRRG